MNTTRSTRNIAAVATALAAVLAAPAVGFADTPLPPPGDVKAPVRPVDPVGPGEIAIGDTPTLEVIHVESDTSFGDLGTQGTVLVAETMPPDANSDPGWWLRVDVRVRNTGNEPVEVSALGLTTDVSTLNVEGIETVVIEPGDTHTFMPHDLTGDGPAPTWFTINVYAPTAAPFPAQATYELDVHQNPTPAGGYRFPARFENLSNGAFWTPGSFHAHSTSQRYAYDLNVVRWNDDSDKWVVYTEQAYIDDTNGIPLGSRNEHFLIFGQPVYSMADGVIDKCRRSYPDKDPGFDDNTPSNVLGITHFDGEYAAYGHFQELSIPAHLCPVETPGDGVADKHVKVVVKEGQFLGYAGNSGTANPHLHVHVSDAGIETPSWRIRGLPLNFHDVFVLDYDDFDPTTDPANWEWVSSAESAAIGYRQLIHPNTCGWGVPESTIGDVTIGGANVPQPPQLVECHDSPDPLGDDDPVVAGWAVTGDLAPTGSNTTGDTADLAHQPLGYIPVRRPIN